MSIISSGFYRTFATKLLDRRYNTCNRNRHKKVVNGVCTYCFRNYPQTDQQKITDRYKGLIILIDSLKELNLHK